MKVLQGFALAVLSLILLLSLVAFGAAYTVNSTLLNPDFVAAEVDKLDISSIAGGLLAEQIGENLPEEARFLEGIIYIAISEIISAQEPWIKEQASAAVYSVYDFLLGESDRLVITVSIESFKEALGDSLRESLKPVIRDLLPAQLAGAPQPLIDQYIDQYFDDFYQPFADEVPSEFVIDEGFIPPDVMQQIIMARQVISYFQTGYYGLIAFMALVVLGIVLIGRRLRSIMLALGITSLLYGALQYAAIFVGKDLLPSSLTLYEVPSVMQAWLLGVINDFTAPLEVLSLGMLAGGVALLVVSFIIKLREAEA